MTQHSNAPVSTAPRATFTDADHHWLSTTAESDTGLALELDKDHDDRGEMVLAYGPGDAPQHPWWVQSLPLGVSVERFLERPEATDKWDTDVGPAVFFSSLRAALKHITAETGAGPVALAA